MVAAGNRVLIVGLQGSFLQYGVGLQLISYSLVIHNEVVDRSVWVVHQLELSLHSLGEAG